MIQLGRYTFESEAHRAADYRKRVGPLQKLRTVQRPDPSQPLASWLNRDSVSDKARSAEFVPEQGQNTPP